MTSNRTFRTLAAAIAALLGSPTCVEANDVEFRARIDDIKIARQFDKETIVTGVDPRFVVKLTLEQDVEGIGKRGETVSFAIHSPARDLRITNQQAAAGARIHLKFSHSKESGFKLLRRISANKARAVAPPGDPP